MRYAASVYAGTVLKHQKLQVAMITDSGKVRVGCLVGAPYSGSTLMAFLMDSHPQIASLGETMPNRRTRRCGLKFYRGAVGEPYVCSCGERLDSCQLFGQLFHSVQRQGVALSASNWTIDYEYQSRLLHGLLDGESARPMVRHLRHMADALLPFQRQKILRTDRAIVAFMRAVLDLKRVQVFFETKKDMKRVYRFIRLTELDVRVVRMVRDVRGFVNSSKKRGQSVEAAATSWKRHHLAADRVLAGLPKEKVFTLKYEDLCRETTTTMSRLYEFLNVAPFTVPEVIDPRKHHIVGNSMRLRGPFRIAIDEEWRDTLSQNEIDLALRIAQDVNERFGYPTVSRA